MDIQMPVMDGYAGHGAAAPAAGAAHVPIVALTANAIKGEREKCLAAGMDDYLTKPFKEDELLHKVSQMGTACRRASPNPKLPWRQPWQLPWRLPWRRPLAPVAATATSETTPSAASLYQTDELLHVGQGDLEFVRFMLETFVESCEEASSAGFAQGRGRRPT